MLRCAPPHQWIPWHCTQSLHWDSGRHCRWFYLHLPSYFLMLMISVESVKQRLLNDVLLRRASEPAGGEIWSANAHQLQHSSRFLHPDEAGRSGPVWRKASFRVYQGIVHFMWNCWEHLDLTGKTNDFTSKVNATSAHIWRIKFISLNENKTVFLPSVTSDQQAQEQLQLHYCRLDKDERPLWWGPEGDFSHVLCVRRSSWSHYMQTCTSIVMYCRLN